jgi:hypothetical protein
MERLAEHRFARAIASRVAFRMHPCALKRLAEARASVALINKKFYVAKGILSGTSLAGFSGFDVRLAD